LPSARQLETRLKTGIPGLDDILHGGLPAGHLYLIEGNPGSGKTTFGLQFLLAGVAAGERALYVTLAESQVELEQSEEFLWAENQTAHKALGKFALST